MPISIVLTGAEEDAAAAASWARKQAKKAKFSAERAAMLGADILSAYRAAAGALFRDDPRAQMVMVSLDLNGAKPRFELICDGALSRGLAQRRGGLGANGRRRHGLLDGITCISPA